MKRQIILFFMILLLSVVALLAGDAFCARQVLAEEIRQSLPTVYLHIDGGQDEVHKMNSSWDHSYHCKGTMDIVVPEGFHYTDSDAELNSLKDLKMDIRGRGNTSWLGEGGKNPYKIKLDDKQDILGMGKNKHWVLIANAFDPSLMRNRITYWLGRELGMAFTPSGYPVDVYMEGEYYGSYLLCENIRVGKTRVNIDELTEDDNDMADITGGYLMSMKQDEDSPSVFTTEKGEDLQNVTPSFDLEGGGDGDYENDHQKQYIRSYAQEAEYALNEGYVPDETQSSGYRQLNYKDYFDIKSASLYWLMQEFSNNNDAYITGSTYFYKTRDQDGQKGRIFWGPLWDFDFAWDYKEFDDDDAFTTDMGWMTAMMTDTGEGGLPDQIKKDWPVLKKKLDYIIQDGGLLQQYYEETKISQAADYEKNQLAGYDNYEEAVDVLRQWITRRIQWMDGRINDLDHYAHKVFLKSNPEDEFPQVFCVRDEQIFSGVVADPEAEGKVFVGWYTDKGENLMNLNIVEDTVATARFIDYDEAVKPEEIYLGSYEQWVPFSSGQYLISYTLLPENAQEKKIKWTSSDESIATVDKAGGVQFLAEGDVTITGSSGNGLTASVKLHICDDEQLQLASSLEPSRKEFRMKPGEHQQLLPVISPENTEYTHYYYSEDEDIAQINENGVITAKKKGNTTIKIFVMSQYGGEYLDLVTSCQVFVSDSTDSEEEETEKESPSGRNEIPAGISPSNPAGAATVDKQITDSKNEENSKGSTFCLLRAKGVAKSKTSVKISWKKIAGAEKYIIYGNRCGAKNRYKKIKKVTGTSFTQKKLKKGTYYKYIVVAVNGDKTFAVSKSVHVVTRGGKAGNARSITTKARKNKVSVKKGKSFKLGAKAVAWSRRLKMRNHRGISYESDNKKVAAVSGKGVIKGVSEGTCNVFVYAQNGVYKKIKVTVK